MSQISLLEKIFLYGSVNSISLSESEKLSADRMLDNGWLIFSDTLFSIQEISRTINSLTSDGSSEEMYDNFVMCMNGEKREGLADVIVAACDTVRLYKKTHDLVEKLK